MSCSLFRHADNCSIDSLVDLFIRSMAAARRFSMSSVFSIGQKLGPKPSEDRRQQHSFSAPAESLPGVGKLLVIIVYKKHPSSPDNRYIRFFTSLIQS